MAQCILDWSAKQRPLNSNCLKLGIEFHHKDGIDFCIPIRNIEAFSADFLARELSTFRQSSREVPTLTDSKVGYYETMRLNVHIYSLISLCPTSLCLLEVERG